MTSASQNPVEAHLEQMLKYLDRLSTGQEQVVVLLTEVREALRAPPRKQIKCVLNNLIGKLISVYVHKLSHILQITSEKLFLFLSIILLGSEGEQEVALTAQVEAAWLAKVEAGKQTTKLEEAQKAVQEAERRLEDAVKETRCAVQVQEAASAKVDELVNELEVAVKARDAQVEAQAAKLVEAQKAVQEAGLRVSDVAKEARRAAKVREAVFAEADVLVKELEVAKNALEKEAQAAKLEEAQKGVQEAWRAAEVYEAVSMKLDELIAETEVADKPREEAQVEKLEKAQKAVREAGRAEEVQWLIELAFKRNVHVDRDNPLMYYTVNHVRKRAFIANPIKPTEKAASAMANMLVNELEVAKKALEAQEKEAYSAASDLAVRTWRWRRRPA